MPDPISTPDLWDLHASPSAVQTLADAWERASESAREAADTVERAARNVFSDEAWEGATAEAYDSHRRKFGRDLEEFADKAKAVARGLEELADMLRSGQGNLDNERDRISDVFRIGEDQLVFFPEDDEQADRVRSAIEAASEIRAGVDEKLEGVRRGFGSVSSELAAIGENWAPRSVRVMDMNIFQGGDGNDPGDPEGTDPGDIPSLGQRILDEEVDVATFQETFDGSMHELQDWLNEHSPPGERWRLDFQPGTTAGQYPGVDEDEDPIEDEFGVTTLVREGGDVERARALEPTELEEDGGVEGRQMSGVRLDLADE